MVGVVEARRARGDRNCRSAPTLRRSCAPAARRRRRRSRPPCRRRASPSDGSRPSPSAALRGGWTCRSRLAHDSGQPVGDDEVGRIDEALEAGESEFGELHLRCLFAVDARPGLVLAPQEMATRLTCQWQAPLYGYGWAFFHKILQKISRIPPRAQIVGALNAGLEPVEPGYQQSYRESVRDVNARSRQP